MTAAAENPNVRLLAACYEAWHATRGGSTEKWLEILGEPFELMSICGGREGAEFTASCSCREEVVGYLAGLTGDWEMEFTHMDDFISEGERVVAIGRVAWRNRRTGKRFEGPKVDVWRFRDGKALTFAEYYDSAGMIEAATP